MANLKNIRVVKSPAVSDRLTSLSSKFEVILSFSNGRHQAMRFDEFLKPDEVAGRLRELAMHIQKDEHLVEGGK